MGFVRSRGKAKVWVRVWMVLDIPHQHIFVQGAGEKN